MRTIAVRCEGTCSDTIGVLTYKYRFTGFVSYGVGNVKVLAATAHEEDESDLEIENVEGPKDDNKKMRK